MFAFMLDMSGYDWSWLLPLWVGIIVAPVFLVQLERRHFDAIRRLVRHLFVALVLAVALGTVHLYAVDLFLECDFETLVEAYGYWWAWAWWIGSHCY